jgi:dTDP-4-amino-4,6-dideoxygalactose transaminase
MVDKNASIFVNKPYLPPLEEILPYLQTIWNNRVLTNIGPLHKEFEEKLCNYLCVENISLFTNGTIALMTALKCLEITGEVITTPYSFAATSHALIWQGLTPVFADINSESLNIDPGCIEELITPRTTAILAVHCYGIPCETEAIQNIADKYKLKVIYDAAHAFGVECDCGSLLNHGDLSVLSLHATKVFNTFEGGAVICKDSETKKKLDRLKSFGYDGEDRILEAGINGKMSEFNAAVGLVQLAHIETVLNARMTIDQCYKNLLAGIQGIQILNTAKATKHNYSYFPIRINQDYPLTRDELYEYLRGHGIYPRKYFYPLLSDLPVYQGFKPSNPDSLQVARKAASQIICLPIYPGLSEENIARICNLLIAAK